MTRPRVGFLGMTHLGLCSAAAAAAKGFETIAFDPDGARVARLEAGSLPVLEPDLDRLVAEHRARLRFTAKPGDLAACDLAYVAPDVPTDDAGRSDLADVETLLGIADDHLAPIAVRVVLSQVPPGFTRRQRTRGPLHYQVETLVFGRAVERALAPERFIVGCADPAAVLPPALQRFLDAFGCPVLPMGFESAELAKVAINAFLVASVTTTNVLAELCERIGADWSEIAPSLRLDRRIGPHAYLTPGLGIAGGNLERDLATIQALAAQHGSDATPVGAAAVHSRHRREWMLRVLHQEVLARRSGSTEGARPACIALLGLAYKPDTSSTRNSPALALVDALPALRFQAWDPVVTPESVGSAGLAAAASAEDAVRGAEALVIATAWPVFAALDPVRLAAAMTGRTVIDPFGVLPSAACAAAGLDHFQLGRTPTRAPRRT